MFSEKKNWGQQTCFFNTWLYHLCKRYFIWVFSPYAAKLLPAISISKTEENTPATSTYQIDTKRKKNIANNTDRTWPGVYPALTTIKTQNTDPRVLAVTYSSCKANNNLYKIMYLTPNTNQYTTYIQ